MNPYFEQMILSASPIELVRLMYQQAIAAVADAREHLREGCGQRVGGKSVEVGIKIEEAAQFVLEALGGQDFRHACDRRRLGIGGAKFAAGPFFLFRLTTRQEKEIVDLVVRGGSQQENGAGLLPTS